MNLPTCPSQPRLRPRTLSAPPPARPRRGAESLEVDLRVSNEAEPVIGLPTERASAVLPENLLGGGEVIILLLKPSAWYVLLSSTGALAVIWGLVLSAVWVRSAMSLGPLSSADLLALGAILSAIQLGWQSLEWLSRNYVLTDRRVIRTRGVVRMAVFQATFAQLDGAKLVASPREKVMGLGSIAFYSKGSGYPAAHWLMLRRPQAVYDRVLKTIERYGGNGPTL